MARAKHLSVSGLELEMFTNTRAAAGLARAPFGSAPDQVGIAVIHSATHLFPVIKICGSIGALLPLNWAREYWPNQLGFCTMRVVYGKKGPDSMEAVLVPSW